MEFLFLPIGLLIWAVVIVIHYLRHGHLKTHHFFFSARNYYLMMLCFVLGQVIISLSTQSAMPLVIFLVFGVFGVIGETIFSFWWHLFFGQRFWVYEEEALLHGYTSFLNFIPWGVGGLMYLTLSRFVIDVEKTTAIFSQTHLFFDIGIIFLLSACIQLSVFHYLGRNHHDFKYHRVTAVNFLLFCLPVIFITCYFFFIFGPVFIGLLFLFGIIPTAAEYLFGKGTQFFISKKMWIYSYNAYDHGHFTPLAIPAFILGGYYFWIIGTLFQLVRLP